VPGEKIRYLPNCAESAYRPVAVESDAVERRMMPNGFSVLFAGNLGKAQDLPTILNAAEKLKHFSDIHWVILGDGTMRSWVDEMIRRRGLDKNVHILGRFPVMHMPRFFSLADALLVTLKKDPIFAITIPSKVQAYLACGKPIIAALDGEGARVIAESGGGMAVPSGDADRLAEAVLRLYKMERQDLERMGRLSREYSVKNFERNRLLDLFDTWIREEVKPCVF
jgi:glycosyltransferase involved in cell wall biosynthesis